MSKDKESSSSVNFVCQRCMLPIKIDPSFNSLDEHTLAELHLPLYAPPNLDLDETSEASGVVDKFVPGLKKASSTNNTRSSGSGDSSTGNQGFTIVNTSSEMTPQETSLLKTHMELFDILSNNTEIDHPLCDECCDTLINLLDTELRAAEEESNNYDVFLKKLENEHDSEDIEGLEQQLKELKREEGTLRGELNELKIEEATALENLQRQKTEFKRLKEQEDEFLKEYCRNKRQLNEIEDYGMCLDYELKYVEEQIDRLLKTNALNATFHIWQSGSHFGTINTFRLGRLPSEPVDWNEINAAWGQTALLLNSLARRMSFKFSSFQIVPFGNHSYIKVLADNTELPLHGSGGFRFIWDNKFDQGMTAFLDCLAQLQATMLERPGKNGFSLPYKMSEKGKIEDHQGGKTYSVRTQLNSEEHWTKALKFMLTNLKWALAWVTAQTVTDGHEIS